MKNKIRITLFLLFLVFVLCTSILAYISWTDWAGGIGGWTNWAGDTTGSHNLEDSILARTDTTLFGSGEDWGDTSQNWGQVFNEKNFNDLKIVGMTESLGEGWQIGAEESNSDILNALSRFSAGMMLYTGFIYSKIDTLRQIPAYFLKLSEITNKMNISFAGLPSQDIETKFGMTDFLDSNAEIEPEMNRIWGGFAPDESNLSKQIDVNTKAVKSQLGYIRSLRSEMDNADSKIDAYLKANNRVSNYGQAVMLQTQGALEIYRGYKRITETKARALQTEALILENQSNAKKMLITYKKWKDVIEESSK